MDYDALRQQYPRFIYQDCSLIYNDNELQITFLFNIPGLCTFAPHWIFPLRRALSESERKCVQEMAFSLGMVELISYWKCVCSPHIDVEAGFLTAEQVQFWQNLMFHGLGEFFHVNQIPCSPSDMPDILCSGSHKPFLEEFCSHFSGSLIPVGGGKDSLVSLSFCPDVESEAFFVNPKPSALTGANIAGFSENRRYIATRQLDTKILDLNKKGFLNGHTPFSALLAFASVLAAYLCGRERVVLSNEQSANEPTAPSGANHQYSKSYAFESDFRQYLSQYLTKKVDYFSFLRPINELQIAALFAQKPQFHQAFRSCNRGSRDDLWCGSCAKCLFVNVILSPFLPPLELTSVFNTNIWENTALLPDFMGLIGASEIKPFECVGSRDEVNAALKMCIRAFYNDANALPFLLDYYVNSSQYKDDSANSSLFLNYFCQEHHLPSHYVDALQNALKGLSV